MLEEEIIRFLDFYEKHCLLEHPCFIEGSLIFSSGCEPIDISGFHSCCSESYDLSSLYDELCNLVERVPHWEKNNGSS